MVDIELLKRLAEAAAQGEYESKQDWDDGELFNVLAPTDLRVKAGPVMKTIATCNDPEQAEFFAAANPAAVLALIAENEELAERIRLFELVHGGRASELYHQISALHAEVRRLKIAAGEDVPPLPEEFVGPLPERPYSRLRRKLQEQQKPAGGAGAAENCRCNEKLQVVQAELERAREDAERYAWLRERGDACQWMNIIRVDPEDYDSVDAAIDAAMGKGGRVDV